MGKKKKKKTNFRFWYLVGLAVIAAAAAGYVTQIVLNLPDVAVISAYTPFETTEIYSVDGEILAALHADENRTIVPLSKISPYLQNAVVASEDERFWTHPGVDYRGIVRAFFLNILRGRISEGGSTITQQLARTIFLTRKRTFTRKLTEILIALQIERKFSKEEILDFYLNNVYWGHNAYGAEAAAQIFLGKHAHELNLAESSLLAGIIAAPEYYSPYKNMQFARQRQKLVLEKMVKDGFIKEKNIQTALQTPLKLSMQNLNKYKYVAPYFTSYVISQLIDKYGYEIVYKGGLRVYTTLDLEFQKIASRIIDKFMGEEGSRYQFSQAALIAIDPRTGYIKALVGGKDFNLSEFNRATQAKRPTGSSFKPFVYAAALEKKISPGYLLDDSATRFKVPVSEWTPEGLWKPQNFDKKFRGKVSMRTALEKSLNIPSIKLLKKVGIESAIEMARKAGIKGDLVPSLSLTLGTSDLTLLEMTSAFCTFANLGIRVEPLSITKILGKNGEMIDKQIVTEKRTIDENVILALIDLMKGVLTRGTGYKGRINRPAAAKTGTTDKFRDAWFIGFVPQLCTGVWVGNDDNATMQGVAEVAVCPRIWKEFMEETLKDEPILDFPQVTGMEEKSICLDSGKLASPSCPKNRVIKEKFWKDNLPKQDCEVHEIIIEIEDSTEEAW